MNKANYYQGSGFWDWVRNIPEGLSRILRGKQNVSSISPFIKELIKLEKSTYDPSSSEVLGWRTILPTERVRVFKKGSQIVIAVRGTDKTNSLDIYDDVLVAKGSLDKSPRFQELKRIYEAVVAKYPNDEIILIGHSLGGGMVIELTKYFNGLKGHVFNPAVNLSNLRSNKYNLKNIQGHIMEHDPLSLTSQFLPNAIKYNYPFQLTGQASDHIKAHELDTFLA